MIAGQPGTGKTAIAMGEWRHALYSLPLQLVCVCVCVCVQAWPRR